MQKLWTVIRDNKVQKLSFAGIVDLVGAEKAAEIHVETEKGNACITVRDMVIKPYSDGDEKKKPSRILEECAASAQKEIVYVKGRDETLEFHEVSLTDELRFKVRGNVMAQMLKNGKLPMFVVEQPVEIRFKCRAYVIASDSETALAAWDQVRRGGKLPPGTRVHHSPYTAVVEAIKSGQAEVSADEKPSVSKAEPHEAKALVTVYIMENLMEQSERDTFVMDMMSVAMSSTR